MSEKIIQLNEGIIKNELKELVRNSVEETLNGLLEQEAQQLTNAAKYERTEGRQGYPPPETAKRRGKPICVITSWGPLAPGQTPHHAVKENATNVYAQGSRDILDKHGLNPNIAKNGARLWGTHPNQISQPGHPGAAGARIIGNYHGGTHIHGKANDKLIYKTLKTADKKGLNMKNVLSDITGRMESGSWKKTFTSCRGR